MNYRIGQRFIDEYGKVWRIISFFMGKPELWNDEVGMGLWDDGRGLTTLI
jgi:hypothetical protein